MTGPVRPAGWTLGRRITALSAAVAVLLGMIAVTAAVTATANRAAAENVLDRIGPAASNAEKLLSAALRQQAGLRGYASTGRGEELDRYTDGVNTERDVYTETGRMLAAEPPLRARLDRIHAALEGWRTDVATPLLARVRSAGPDPALATADRATQDRFQTIVNDITEFQQAVNRERALRRTDVQDTANLLVILLISAAVVIAAAGFALAALLRRLVTQPVTDLAGEVRRVAGGDYEHEISGTGPPEVQRLAHDVNGMRKQIAADLNAVHRARRAAEEARGAAEEARRQLEAQAEELTRSNRDLEQFAYVASHDLQEPLRKVASFCQLLQRRYSGQLDERADQYIYFAVDGAQRMQRLINDLLAFSRIGRITSGFADVDLNRTITEVVGQREGMLEYAGGEVTWDELPVVRGEEPLLTALLGNLVGNSLKFRRPNVPPKVHVGCRRVGEEWEVSCADNGIGIDPEYVDKVFVIFQRLHAKDAYPGTGIGLSICKKIVEYHGGRIWIDTERREGTLIMFTLPVAPEAPASPAVPVAASTAEETGS
jgi:signal transduction histidine kinase